MWDDCSVTRFRELSPIKGIFVVFRDQGCFFFFNSEHAQMGLVCSDHVQSVYNLVHVPDSDMCKNAWQLIFKQLLATKHPLQLREI